MMKGVISEDDARAMVRLLGETVALEGGHSEKKRFLMDGLSELIKAECWVWGLGCDLNSSGIQSYVYQLNHGFDDERLAKYLQAIENPVMRPFMKPFFTEIVDSQKHLTWGRDDLDPHGESYIEGVGEYWQAANIGPVLLSFHPVDKDSMSCSALYRAHEEEQFSERDKKIAHIILSEVPWLHLTGWPEDRGAKVPKLYPRQRIVFNLLLKGLDRKQIADKMDISENTVSGYTKDVYRHFGVHSHVEHMHKFLQGHNYEGKASG